MSIEKWAWRESCDKDYCCGDCDHCRKADDCDEESDIVQVWIAESEEEDGI